MNRRYLGRSYFQKVSFSISILFQVSFPNMASSVFSNLIAAHPTWPALSAFLSSAEGGNLRIDDHSSPENPFALIRYSKGRSDLSLDHVRAFRSVVWDTLENRPVSVTAFKSRDGETLPVAADDADVPSTYSIEYFQDGVMIGMFWDKYNKMWRIHTRSMLDAQCRYFSQTKTFNTMFSEAIGSSRVNVERVLNVNTSYTWVLQHPENRIVVPVKTPRVYCVEAITIQNNGDVSVSAVPDAAFPAPKVTIVAPTWKKLRDLLVDWNRRFGHSIQGLVVKNGLERYKLRTTQYNTVRQRRGNSARRDYLWLTEWRSGTLPAYLDLYPEERAVANATIARWKAATNDVYHWYIAVFKARDTPKHHIPPKYRPLVYGLHNLYMNTLKPASKSVDWKTCLSYMNERDTAQMLFVMNWDLRQSALRMGTASIPIEPSATTSAETHVEGDIDAATSGISGRPGTPSEVPPSRDMIATDDAAAPGGGE
jgi:hypothetical protein